MNRFLCQQGTMHLNWRKSVQSLHHCFISHLQCFLYRFSFYKLCRHTAGRHSCTAAKCLELTILNNTIVINIQIHTHDVSALSIADGTYTTCVFNLTHIAGIIKMIHYLFAVHTCRFLSIIIIYFWCFTKSSYNGDMERSCSMIFFSSSTV